MITEKDKARFWAKVAPVDANGCALWTASRDRKGYGRFGLAGKTKSAHRIAYELANGSIPPGLVLDHLCRVRHCVAPLHLEAVTNAENIRRGEVSAWQRAKTHCPQGHPYADGNLYVRPDGWRECRACHRATSLRHFRASRSASSSTTPDP